MYFTAVYCHAVTYKRPTGLVRQALRIPTSIGVSWVMSAMFPVSNAAVTMPFSMLWQKMPGHLYGWALMNLARGLSGLIYEEAQISIAAFGLRGKTSLR